MAKITIVTGVLLILLGLASYLYTGHQYPTSLIPSAFGILLVAFGSMAETPVAKRRMLFMHIAVTVGLLGFLATAPALVSVVQLFKGKLFPYPAAIEEKAAMSALMLIYVVLCVRSFIAARRSGVAGCLFVSSRSSAGAGLSTPAERRDRALPATTGGVEEA